MSAGAHPNAKLYVKVAAWLAVVTGVEVLLSYVTLPPLILLAALIVLSLIKFIVVVGYFMHLKFDQPLLRKPLLAGLITAFLVYSIVLANMIMHSNTPA
jgi:cytochrome c oxidase subunit IV